MFASPLFEAFSLMCRHSSVCIVYRKPESTRDTLSTTTMKYHTDLPLEIL